MDQFSYASASTNEGVYALVSLFIAIASAELFNQGQWQRVWAAKSDFDFGLGVLLGSFLIFLVMMFFGAWGSRLTRASFPRHPSRPPPSRRNRARVLPFPLPPPSLPFPSPSKAQWAWSRTPRTPPHTTTSRSSRA